MDTFDAIGVGALSGCEPATAVVGDRPLVSWVGDLSEVVARPFEVSDTCTLEVSSVGILSDFGTAELAAATGFSDSLSATFGVSTLLDCGSALSLDEVVEVVFCASLASHVLRLAGSRDQGSGLASPPASHSWDDCSGTR
jgi:hypothetical protein